MTYYLFDFYHLFVELIFGNVLFSILAVSLILFLLLVMSRRASATIVILWLTFYYLCFGTLYFGALAMVLAFIGGVMYAIIAGLRLFARSS